MSPDRTLSRRCAPVCASTTPPGHRYADRGHADGHARHVVDALDRGDPVVLVGWELARYHRPEFRPGRHAFYRIEPNGRVLEVVVRRDPHEPLAIVGWDEVTG